MLKLSLCLLVVYCLKSCRPLPHKPFPLVINTWNFPGANQNAWEVLSNNGSALDAIEKGCNTCERELHSCDHTVGWGGNCDESGESTQEALIMDGPSHEVGAVASLRRVKSAISVARKVLEHTEHTLLVGDLATNFALQMGFKMESLSSEWSKNASKKWKQNKCQPNFWRNVEPNPMSNCGPYIPIHDKSKRQMKRRANISRLNHDTIGMVAIDSNGGIAVGTSTNGLIHKIPGRVGDSPLPGSGAYVDQNYGGAAATGDGDIIMRFSTSYQAVENLRQGMDVKTAAKAAIRRVVEKYPFAMAAIVVVDTKGGYGAACINIRGGFPYAVSNPTFGKTTIKRVDCLLC